MGIKIISY